MNSRRIVQGAALTFCTALASGLQAPDASAKTPILSGVFEGSAHTVSASGITGAIGAHLNLAPHATCPCQGTNGKPRGETINGLVLGTGGSVLITGAAAAQVTASRGHGTAEETEVSTISGVNLLGGLITADAIAASADVQATPTALKPSAIGSGFTNLYIGGVAVPANVPPNTVYALPGVGKVTLNMTRHRKSSLEAVAAVDMLRLDVTANNAFLPVGASLTIGQAVARFDRRQPVARLGGVARTLRVTGDDGSNLQQAAVTAAAIGLPGCSGTDGQMLTRSTGAIGVPGVLTINGATATAEGSTTDTSGSSATSATVGSLSLLGGLISAQNITSAAQETYANGTSSGSTTGTVFGQLVVAGVPLPASVPANTSVPLPGIGSVIVNEQTVAQDGTTVVSGLHIKVTTANLLGLPVGANIVVAQATASAHRF